MRMRTKDFPGFFLLAALIVGAGSLLRCGSVNVAGLDPNDFTGDGIAAACAFEADVLPIFSGQGCTAAACHGADAPSTLILDTSAVTEGVDGVHANIVNGRVNTASPADSALLQKPVGAVTHEGGQIFDDTDDADYQTILCWIEAGAAND